MEKSFEKKGLTPKSENISEWYQDVVLKAGLADYSDVRGCMIIRPYGYAIWENIQKTLDVWFKEDGVENAYFPLFIPMSLLAKEKEHLKGFSPELAVVTHGGGEELAEPYAVRPTSETIMYKSFKKWISSYRDLPLKINQWCNVVRWEKRTYLFLRTTEFLWQEGHTVHITEAEAEAMMFKALRWYQKIYEEYLALSPYVGRKSENEKFAGAKTTYSIEAVMPNGKSLQAATSHNLADNFSKVFEIEFTDDQGMKHNPFQTSWGLSTRAIGGLILSHGDDSGLILPPQIAPVQVVILPVFSKAGTNNTEIRAKAEQLANELKLAQIRVTLDADETHSLGYKINAWELKGVPLRLELGEREMAENLVSATRRDNFEKLKFNQQNLTNAVKQALTDIQASLYARNKVLKTELTKEVKDYTAFKQVLREQKVFVRVFWCEDKACEQQIKEETKATTRVLELEHIDQNEQEKCFHCGKSSRRQWLFAQSY